MKVWNPDVRRMLLMLFQNSKNNHSVLSDMERFYQYIAEVLLFPDNAIGQYNRIADAVLTLDELPNDALLGIKNPNIPEGYKGNWLIIIRYAMS